MSVELSIIIPSLNRPVKLIQCLTSIRIMLEHCQVLSEVLLVDDGSTEDMAKRYTQISQEFDCLLIRTKGLGPSGARNIGAMKANGEWIYFIDDDVILSENALSWWPEVKGTLCAGYQGVTKVDSQLEWTQVSPSTSDFEGGFGSGNIIYRRDLFIELGGFDEAYFLKSAGIHFREDTDLGLRFIREGYDIPVNKKMLAYHPSSELRDPWFILRDARKYYFESYFKSRNPEGTKWIGTAFRKGILGTFQLRGFISMLILILAPLIILNKAVVVPLLILYLLLGYVLFRKLSFEFEFLIYVPVVLLSYPWIHSLSYLVGYLFGPKVPKFINSERL